MWVVPKTPGAILVATHVLETCWGEHHSPQQPHSSLKGNPEECASIVSRWSPIAMVISKVGLQHTPWRTPPSPCSWVSPRREVTLCWVLNKLMKWPLFLWQHQTLWLFSSCGLGHSTYPVFLKKTGGSILTVSLFYSHRETFRDPSFRWILEMASLCHMPISAQQKMGSSIFTRMWAYSEWLCWWKTVWDLTMLSSTYMLHVCMFILVVSSCHS